MLLPRLALPIPPTIESDGAGPVAIRTGEVAPVASKAPAPRRAPQRRRRKERMGLVSTMNDRPRFSFCGLVFAPGTDVSLNILRTLPRRGPGRKLTTGHGGMGLRLGALAPQHCHLGTGKRSHAFVTHP